MTDTITVEKAIEELQKLPKKMKVGRTGHNAGIEDVFEIRVEEVENQFGSKKGEVEKVVLFD